MGVQASDSVEALLTATGVVPGSGSVVDWPVIAQSLGGLALPEDYKRVVENFPHGKFKEFVMVVRPGILGGSPGEYLGYFADRLDDLRDQREADRNAFPYPIFPEPGGLLQWADSGEGVWFFWLTEGADPALWPVVWVDEEFTGWHRSAQTMSEFLLTLLLDPPLELAQLIASDPAVSAPFRAMTTRSATKPVVPAPTLGPTPGPTSPEPPIGFQPGHHDPEDDADSLLAVLGARPSAFGTRDWSSLSRAFGSALPADYRTFYGALGYGIFCDIVIFGIDAPAGSGLSDLLTLQRSVVAAHPAASLTVPLHPDPGGLIPWGGTADGWTFCWRPAGSIPELWGVSAIGPGFRRVDSPDLSFSTFLLQYCGAVDGSSLFLFGRDQWTKGPTFRSL